MQHKHGSKQQVGESARQTACSALCAAAVLLQTPTSMMILKLLPLTVCFWCPSAAGFSTAAELTTMHDADSKAKQTVNSRTARCLEHRYSPTQSRRTTSQLSLPAVLQLHLDQPSNASQVPALPQGLVPARQDFRLAASAQQKWHCSTRVKRHLQKRSPDMLPVCQVQVLDIRYVCTR